MLPDTPVTGTGIHLKLKRMKFKHDGTSAYSLAQALGVDRHAVTRWIKSGHLKANPEGQHAQRGKNGDSYLIQEKDVRRFILDTTLVDQIPPEWYDSAQNELERLLTYY